MQMTKNMGMHHGLAQLCEAVIALLQNRKHLSAATFLNSHFVSGIDAGHSIDFLNAFSCCPTEIIHIGLHDFLHGKYVVITE